MKKNKKKGFTLIELLAVIVILAIIALIATPIILNVIDTAKNGAAESSALGYIDAVEKQVMINQVSGSNQITPNVYDKATLTTKKVEVKGGSDITDLKVRVNSKGEVEAGKFCINGKSIYYNGKKAEYKKEEDYCNGNIELEGGIAKSGPTYVAKQTNETHKGIVYLDPTDLTKSCNASNSVSTTETKTGCMKWYIYDDSGDNYKLILDHNTTARIKWNDNNINVAYESSNLYAVVQDLKTTSKWVVNPDLITAEEVNTITGKTDWTNTSSWYYLDTKTQTKADFTSARSKYDWLYNNLNKCKTDSTDYGCSIEDGNTYQGYGTAGNGGTYGYWTKTTYGSAGSGSSVWDVNRFGYLFDNYANNIYNGVRPVITISKSIVS